MKPSKMCDHLSFAKPKICDGIFSVCGRIKKGNFLVCDSNMLYQKCTCERRLVHKNFSESDDSSEITSALKRK